MFWHHWLLKSSGSAWRRFADHDTDGEPQGRHYTIKL
jgi:hypothetical protein